MTWSITYTNDHYFNIAWKAATAEVLLKKVFLKILQTSQENNCVGVSF